MGVLPGQGDLRSLHPSKVLSSITHQPIPDDNQRKTDRYAKEQETIKQTAEEFQKESEERR
jgi:hypothetical protein